MYPNRAGPHTFNGSVPDGYCSTVNGVVDCPRQPTVGVGGSGLNEQSVRGARRPRFLLVFVQRPLSSILRARVVGFGEERLAGTHQNQDAHQNDESLHYPGREHASHCRVSPPACAFLRQPPEGVGSCHSVKYTRNLDATS